MPLALMQASPTPDATGDPTDDGSLDNCPACGLQRAMVKDAGDAPAYPACMNASCDRCRADDTDEPGPIAGETAGEHLRNALQILELAPLRFSLDVDRVAYSIIPSDALRDMERRIEWALAAVETPAQETPAQNEARLAELSSKLDRLRADLGRHVALVPTNPHLAEEVQRQRDVNAGRYPSPLQWAHSFACAFEAGAETLGTQLARSLNMGWPASCNFVASLYPSYTQVRDYLTGEFDYPITVAGRVAMEHVSRYRGCYDRVDDRGEPVHAMGQRGWL